MEEYYHIKNNLVILLVNYWYAQNSSHETAPTHEGGAEYMDEHCDTEHLSLRGE